MKITLNKPKALLASLAAYFVSAQSSIYAQAGGGANELNWKDAVGATDSVSTWLHTIMVALMACFVMVSIILGSLAFKQLAADGNWKDFWSKIAGAIGMFVTPIAIYWIAKQ